MTHRQKRGNKVRLGSVTIDADLLAAFDAAGPTSHSRALKIDAALRMYVAAQQASSAPPTPQAKPTPAASWDDDDAPMAWED